MYNGFFDQEMASAAAAAPEAEAELQQVPRYGSSGTIDLMIYL